MSANIPGEANENIFYDAAPLEPHLLYQGEILVEIPILNMPKPSRWLLLRTRSGAPLDEALKHGQVGGLAKVLDSNQSKEEWKQHPEGDFAMARLSKRPVIVLSQTCDVQTKDFIQVAPIFEVASADVDLLDRLKASSIFSAVWIPKHPPEIPSESYADLELIQAVHRSYITRIRANEHFRLKDERVRSLQRDITRYFGRPNSFDASADTAPATGTYLCVSCFYMDAVVTSISLSQGDQFQICAVCSGRSWILKGR